MIHDIPEPSSQYSTPVKEMDATVQYFPDARIKSEAIYHPQQESPRKSWFNNLFNSKTDTITIKLTKPLHYNLIDMQNSCTVSYKTSCFIV